MKKVRIFGYDVLNDSLDSISEKHTPIVINTISPYTYGLSTKDKELEIALKQSDYLVLDGVYFALPIIILKRKKVQKNQGPEVFAYYMRKINDAYGKVFFLGSSEDTLSKIKKRCSLEYPCISVDVYSPPYKNKFTKNDTNEMIKRVNAFNPDILFVGMTCPKQEKWVTQNKDYIKVKYAISIGGVFDWYARKEKEIAPIWWKLNLAWLIRTINRPEILKRYPYIGIYFIHLIYAIIGIKKYRNEIQ